MISAVTAAPAGSGLDSLAGPLVPTKTPRLAGDPAAADPVAAWRAALRRYYHATSALYDRLFDLIRDERALYERWEPLRHPLIFYFAHPAVFYVNKLVAGRFIPARLDARIEAMMAVGVDEMSWDDLNTAHYDWPSVAAIRDYRRRLRELVDGFIESMPLELPVREDSPAWVILMGIEHERIHLETSSVIMRQMPLAHLRRPGELTAAEARIWRTCTLSGPNPDNPWVDFPAMTVTLGKPAADDTYGWDNEYGTEEVRLAPFSAARQLVSNGEFLRFVEAGGYRNDAWWTDEGRGWLGFTKAEHPKFWIHDGGGYRQRNLLDEIPLPLDWPVEVNCLEAEAYCAWQRATTGLEVRLPGEAHWLALRQATGLPDQPDWESAPGNINLEHFASSCPVTMFPQAVAVPGTGRQEICDVVGNVWQWTRTPIMPFRGFAVHRLYDDFSVPTFDGRHNLIKGGSWIATGNEALVSARYAFRRHFFQHAGFRPIVDAAGHDPVTEGSRLYETDQLVTQYLEFHYGPEALGVGNYPSACVAAVLPFVPAGRRTRCLDIGCSVGRSAFEFARSFAHVDAVDFSARFIQAGVRLQQGDEVLYEVPLEGELTVARSVSLERLGLTSGPGAEGLAGRVAFMQGDACNLKALYTGYDLVFAGNLVDRLYDPALFLAGIAARILPGGILALTSPYTWLEEYTPKAKWLGGRREHGEPLLSFDGLAAALAERFDLVHRGDIPFVIRETARKHQHSISELTVWRLRG
ncbi:MAG: 5-histidylcysteine sulfoxide synthase [Planctomycetes bacterium]|nr:5-histidylcysteine sulfoxide synthase [Planctomycetota bacterium]